MTYSGKVVYRQFLIDGIKLPFEAACLQVASGREYILRFPDQREGLTDARLTSLVGKEIEVLGAVISIPRYPLPMFCISTLKVL